MTQYIGNALEILTMASATVLFMSLFFALTLFCVMVLYRLVKDAVGMVK